MFPAAHELQFVSKANQAMKLHQVTCRCIKIAVTLVFWRAYRTYCNREDNHKVKAEYDDFFWTPTEVKDMTYVGERQLGDSNHVSVWRKYKAKPL